MKRIKYTFIIVLFVCSFAYGQKISGKLKFTQGETLNVVMQTETNASQEAMGQTMEFKIKNSVTEIYTVTNTTEDNSTLNHKIQHILLSFDGMGQKNTVDSDNPKDMKGQLGQPVKDAMDKTFNMIIDPNGKVMMCIPEKFETADNDNPMMKDLMKQIMTEAQPPKKGDPSFFKILPDKEIDKGDSWMDTTANESQKEISSYKLADITDSTLIIDFASTSVTDAKGEAMGMETNTHLTGKTTGKIIVDKATGIMRQKNSTTESSGTVEVMGNSFPLTSKATTNITVTTLQ